MHVGHDEGGVGTEEVSRDSVMPRCELMGSMLMRRKRDMSGRRSNG